MIGHLITTLGPWSWMALGLVLLIMEVLLPGIFLLWIGIAAIVTGALSLVLWDMAFWGWQVQVLVFLALSLLAAFIGKKIMSGREHETDEPLLNRRADQLVGRLATLHEPILDGTGRVRIDDTVWRVSGDDMAAGAKVRITGVSNGILEVSPQS